MSLKIEFEHPSGKVTLECEDGENVMLSGPLEQVNSKHLEDSLMFMVTVLRIHNKEQHIDPSLMGYHPFKEIIISEKEFIENQRQSDQFNQDSENDIKICRQELIELRARHRSLNKLGKMLGFL